MSPRTRLECKSATGAAIVELVVTMPVLVLILVGAADFARVFYASMALTDSARAAVQWASASPTNAKSTSAVSAIATTAATAAGVSVSAGTVCTYECVLNTNASTRKSLTACSATAPTCDAKTEHLEITVAVTVTNSFSAISPYPGIPRPVALSRTVTMRAQ
jgi:Flp pilus assembly protein TadG